MEVCPPDESGEGYVREFWLPVALEG